MDFGRLEESELAQLKIDFPEIKGLTRPVQKTRLQVGCPLWGSDHFRGTLFPKSTRKSEYLKTYSEFLDVLELNTTYHSIHDPELVAEWRDEVSANPEFKFYPKLPRIISHEGRLDHHFDLLMRFLGTVRTFGSHLGMCFLQLPPSFTPMRIHELAGFLELWPADLKLGVEVRHLVWFKNREVHETLRHLLESKNISWVITDTPGMQDVLHQTFTTPEVMVRFVTTGFHDKDRERMQKWSEQFKSYAENGVSDVTFFVHERDEWHWRDILEYMVSLNQHLSVKELPPLRDEAEQLSLF